MAEVVSGALLAVKLRYVAVTSTCSGPYSCASRAAGIVPWSDGITEYDNPHDDT